MKNNRRNRKLTYIRLTNIHPSLKGLSRPLQREMVEISMGSRAAFTMVKMFAMREKLFKQAVENVAQAFDNMAVNTRKILELHPEFLEDPVIRAGIEKTYPDLLPLQSHPLPHDRAE